MTYRVPVWSPQLNNHHLLRVYIPASYWEGDRRYPVLYMQDGQNLFDADASFAGVTWRVTDAMNALAQKKKLEALVVGIDHAGVDRIAEYNPFATRRFPGRGDAYVAFLTDTLKPLVDANFRTRPERECTGIMGSSMGGLISLYAFFTRPDVFGLCGAMSPALWLKNGAMYKFVQRSPYIEGRVYLDHGTREPSAAGMRDALLLKGYRVRRNFRYVAARGAQHTESAWAKRFPKAAEFLLSKTKKKR